VQLSGNVTTDAILAQQFLNESEAHDEHVSDCALSVDVPVSGTLDLLA
jgi:hypothetical protein